jgi:hypothetical protein
MWGGDRPLTRTEAKAMYDRAIADSPQREVMVVENYITGEHIVVRAMKTPCNSGGDDRWREFVADRPRPDAHGSPSGTSTGSARAVSRRWSTVFRPPTTGTCPGRDRRAADRVADQRDARHPHRARLGADPLRLRPESRRAEAVLRRHARARRQAHLRGVRAAGGLPRMARADDRAQRRRSRAGLRAGPPEGGPATVRRAKPRGTSTPRCSH